MDRPLRVALVVHGYPPELRGGTECTVQVLARALARAGHEPLVISGSDVASGAPVTRGEDRDPASGRAFPVVRIHRSDLHYGHWTKAFSPAAGEAFEEVLRAERVDVVHVHHWVRLTRDLVARAARLGIPGVVTLHDLTTTCLIYFRVRPETLDFCEAPLGPDPCLDCAARVYLPTPWLAREEAAEVLERVRHATLRELRTAHAVLALSDDQARTVARLLGAPLAIRTLAPASGVTLPAARRPDPPPAADPRAPLVLGCWATLHRLKGTDLLLEAVRLLIQRGVSVELHLAGIESDPDWIADLRRAAADLPVHFHGPFETLAGHPVTRVHAFVAGTRARETWGVVLDEALSLRLPMVLPRFGAYGTRIPEGDGALFYERGDARSLADVVARLRLEPGLLERLHARLPAASALPTPDDVARAHVEIYRDAVRAGARAVEPEDRAARDADAAYVERWDRGAASLPS